MALHFKETKLEAVVIGLGPLGRRHLEGLFLSEVCKRIHIVDPSEIAIQDTLNFTRKNIVENKRNGTELIDHSDYEKLPKEVDLVIVSTNSRFRLSAVKSFFEKSYTSNMILEKFLFFNSDDYKEFDTLLSKYGTNVYVNTPRRSMESYKKLKHELTDKRLNFLSVEGENWGLATSMIHFLDLFQFLTGRSNLDVLNFNEVKLDDAKSKRVGFQEMFGTLKGRFEDGPSFSISSTESENTTVVVSLFVEDGVFVIDEVKESISFIANKTGLALENNIFRLEYVSEITAALVKKLNANQKIDLTPFELSAYMHKKIIKGYYKSFPKNQFTVT